LKTHLAFDSQIASTHDPTIIQKDGILTYTNYRGARRVSIIALIAASIIICTAILQFLGIIQSPTSDPYWLKGDACMLAMFLGFCLIIVVQAIYLFWHGKSYYVILGRDSLQSNLYRKAQCILFRDISEVRRTQGEGVIRIYCAGKCAMAIPDWFLESKEQDFVDLLKTKIKGHEVPR